MITSFLKRNELAKLRMLAIILYQNKIELKELRDTLNYSTRTIARLVAELNNDIEKSTLSIPDIIINGKYIRLHSNLEDERFFTSYTKKLCLFYLKHSLEYQLFHQIFFKRETNLLTIASHLNTSQSHCYQLLKQLNVILHPFHINIDSKHFDLTIKGEETQVTFFLASAYDIFNVLEDQIVSNPKELFHPLLSHDGFNICNFNNQEVYYIRLLQRVYKERYPYLSHIHLHDTIKPILKTMVIINNPFSQQYFPTSDSLLFYNLYVRTVIPSIDTSSMRNQIGALLTQLHSNPIINSLNALITELYHFFQQHQLSEFTQLRIDEFLYMLTLHTCYIDILHIDIKTLLKEDFHTHILSFLPDTRSQLVIDIENIVASHATSFPLWSSETQQQWIQQMTKVICSLIFPLKQPRLNILIESFSYYSNKCALQHQIANYFSKDMLVFVDNYQEADLIITDQEIPNTRNISHFFIFDHFSNDLWEKLLAMIVQEAHKKLIKSVDTTFI